MILASFFAIACSPSGSPQSEDSLSTGILGGEEVRNGDPLIATTVGLYDGSGGSHCTGSLIADDTVLTAAHCVNPASTNLSIVFDKSFYSGWDLNTSKMVKATSFARHPSYLENRTEGADTFDLAVVHFKGGLPAGYRVVELFSGSLTPEFLQTNLIAAGYGVSNGFFNSGSGVLRKVTLQFRQMHSTTEFETEQNDHGVCSGDSGGPLYVRGSEGWIQVGVASRVATKFLGCRDYAIYTRVDIYRDWIFSMADRLRAGH